MFFYFIDRFPTTTSPTTPDSIPEGIFFNQEEEEKEEEEKIKIFINKNKKK